MVTVLTVNMNGIHSVIVMVYVRNCCGTNPSHDMYVRTLHYTIIIIVTVSDYIRMYVLQDFSFEMLTLMWISF